MSAGNRPGAVAVIPPLGRGCPCLVDSEFIMERGRDHAAQKAILTPQLPVAWLTLPLWLS